MPARHPFRHHQRLHGRRQFDAVFAARCRKNLGPMSVLARPNDLAYSRLGLVVSRRVGNAVRRHRIKRLIREAFRLQQHDLPAGYDVVIVVHPHAPRHLTEYGARLREAMEACDRVWRKRGHHAEPGQTPPQ